MDAVIDCYFRDIFISFDRGSLICPLRRNQIIEYFSTVIEGCAIAEEIDVQILCDKAINIAIEFHRAHRDSNSDICLLGKYHNILYVAVKLCFKWNLQNSDTVASLLENIFMCERSFERIFSSAIFGIKVSHILSGWRSDFCDKNESIKSVEYFLEHATNAMCTYNVGEEMVKFIDLPIDLYGKLSPIDMCLNIGEFYTLKIFLHYGASLSLKRKPDKSPSIIESLKVINDYLYTNTGVPQKYLDCFRFSMRALPPLFHILQAFSDVYPEITIHPDLISKLVYDNNSIISSLKHICRIEIRKVLSSNYQLPKGIYQLKLPTCLKAYLDLEEE